MQRGKQNLKEPAKSEEKENWGSGDLPIEIRGERFAYTAHASGMIDRGMLIKTSAPLGLGTEVIVYTHRGGRSASARIVSQARELSHCGVELTSPDKTRELLV